MNSEQQLQLNSDKKNDSPYVETEKEMRALLLDRYHRIPEGDAEAYTWLRRRAGIEDENLTYDQKRSRHETLCFILGFSPRGGLAGRDINEF